MVDELGTTPAGAIVQEQQLEQVPEDPGWKSRKFLITVGVTVATLVGSFISAFVLGDTDTALIWHGRLGEGSFVTICFACLGSIAAYCGFNVFEKIKLMR